MRQTRFIVAVAAALAFACTDIDEPPTKTTDTAQDAAKEEETPTVEGCTVLGDQIEIPYTTDNMRRAMAAVRAGNKAAVVGAMTEDDIATTHLYLRFAPRDSADVMALETDTTIMFSDVPMDREIAAAGDYYHDPALPDSVPTYQYCAVRVGQPLPDVPHETLAELFLMEETNVYDDAETENEDKNKAADPLWETLEAEAYAMVGLSDYLEEDDDEPAAGNKAKWRPGGRLSYEDSHKGVIPMEGVPIRYHKVVVVHQCCTDAQGNFNFGRRRSKVSYYAKWQRDNFHIRGIGKAVTVAKTWLSGNVRRRVDFVIRPDRSEAWKYASVFRAAHTYYYKYADYGISRPNDRNLYIRLSSRTPQNIRGEYFSWNIPTVTDVYIYYKDRTLNSSSEFFAVTIHEIGHAAHRGWDFLTYRRCGGKVCESWARGVQWYVTSKVYPDYQPGYHGDYTGIVQDLVDDDASPIYTKNRGTVVDKVRGFTITEIENALKGANGWNEWARRLANTRRDERERQEVLKLFDAWDNYRY